MPTSTGGPESAALTVNFRRLTNLAALGFTPAEQGNMGTVLLVENNLDLAYAVREELVTSDFDVTIATSSAKARALERTFDVGVFDLAFEEESGFDLAQELLAGARITRAVFFTSACWQPLLRRAVKVGPLIEKDQGPFALVAELREPTHRPAHSTRLDSSPA